MSRKTKKILIGIVAAVVGLMILGALVDSPDEKSNASESKPAVVKEEPTPTVEEEPAAVEAPDSGRMDDGEYQRFSDAQQGVVDESLQFSTEYQPCSVIGQNGDLAGFRTCVKDAYSGFEDKVSFALYTADDLKGDVDGRCLAALKSYETVLNQFSRVVGLAQHAAEQLDFDAMPTAFNAMPRTSRRYVRFATNVLGACQPE